MDERAGDSPQNRSVNSRGPYFTPGAGVIEKDTAPPCPHCGAKANEPCRTAKGRRASHVHEIRRSPLAWSCENRCMEQCVGACGAYS